MSESCSVKGCPSSTRASKRPTLYSFPSDDVQMRKTWLDKVDLQHKISSDTTKICSLHFDDRSFMKIEENGSMRSLLTTAVPLEYKEMGKQILNMKSSDGAESSLNSSNRIKDFKEFIVRVTENSAAWKENWKIFQQADGVCFYRLSRDEHFRNVKISFKILVNKEMQVMIYDGENEAAASELNWILRNSSLELWSQFYSMLDHYELEPDVQEKPNPFEHIKKALEHLSKVSSLNVLGDLIDPIKLRLAMILPQEDPINEMIHAVKVEPTVDIEEMEAEFFVEDSFLKEDNDQDSDDDVYEVPSPIRKQRKKTTKLKPTSIKRAKPKVEGLLFNCEHCERVFDTKLRRKNHFYTAHDGPVYCDKCGKKFPSRRALHAHMIRHQENNRIKCPQCDAMLMQESLRRHIRVQHEGYKPFGCSICGKLFSSKSLVKEHEKIHRRQNFGVTLDDAVNKYQCPKCHKPYDRGGKVFESHVEKCRGIRLDFEVKRAYVYPCLECGKKFMSKVTSADHMALVHNVHIANIEKFCFECKAEFDDPMHARIHNCAFQCQMCGTRFISQNKLDNHVRDKHQSGEDRPFACDLCSLSFKTNNHLRSHKTSMHTTSEEKRFVCSICHKRYGFQFQLTTHIKTHSDVKRFACNFCDMRFKKLSGMKEHSKRIHGEENVYLCPDCPDKLKTLNELKSHRQDQHGVSINVQKYHD